MNSAALSLLVGVVIMHGKGGSPARHVAPLASYLEEKGFLVANLEMPWSGRRGYDVDVGAAEKEVEAALSALRAKGAKKVFVAGHSQGGLFALYFGGQHAVDGIIAVAPGGNVANDVFRSKLGDSVPRARKLIAEGKGGEKASFEDWEGSKGTLPVRATAATYLTWFDPDGAMNQTAAVKAMNPKTPVLYIGPKRDYPGLWKAREAMFAALPANALSRLYEPESSHIDAPFAAREEIARWMTQTAAER